MFQTIVYSIFTVVASTYAPQFPNMAASESFVKRLMEAFLSGFGIAIGVSLFIVPMTSRTIASKQIAGFVKLLQLALTSHEKYMASISARAHSMEEVKGVDVTDKEKADGVHDDHFFHHKAKATEVKKQGDSDLSAEAAAMKQALFQIGALFGKLSLEITFAKKEVAYGKLRPSDFDSIVSHLRSIFAPILGMTTFIDVVQSVKRRKGAEREALQSSDTVREIKRLELEEWDEIYSISQKQCKEFNQIMYDGLTHVSLVLELVKKPKAPVTDVEKQGGCTQIVIEQAMPA